KVSQVRQIVRVSKGLQEPAMHGLVSREFLFEREYVDCVKAVTKSRLFVQVEKPDDKLSVTRMLAVSLDGLNDARHRINPQVHPETHDGRINEPHTPLVRVASRAGVEEVCVLADSQRSILLRLHMVSREGCVAIRIPKLAFQAVNTTECEFVTEPWFE